jgi:hypothetical protein
MLFDKPLQEIQSYHLDITILINILAELNCHKFFKKAAQQFTVQVSGAEN